MIAPSIAAKRQAADLLRAMGASSATLRRRGLDEASLRHSARRHARRMLTRQEASELSADRRREAQEVHDASKVTSIRSKGRWTGRTRRTR